MDDEFLTVAEVAELLKVNQQTVRNWLDQGALAETRLGKRRVRIRRIDLDRFIQESSPLRKPVPAPPDPWVIESWVAFATAMEQTTRAFQAENRSRLADGFRQLAAAASTIADTLAPDAGS